MQIAYTAKEIFNGQLLLPDQAVLVRDGKVVDLVSVTAIPSQYRLEILAGQILAPAFMDLQIYGANGKLFSTDLSLEALDAVYQYGLQGGCTRFMITMATNSMEKLFRAMELVQNYWLAGRKGLLGLHLEGPYINVLKKGAHLECYIKKPSMAEIERILETAKGCVKMMTLAPECCDAAIIESLIKAGMLVSAGHSNADYGQATNGFNQGIPAVTHLFNAMSALQGRAPGMVGAVFDHPDVMSSIVCDGVHVDYACVRIAKQIMGKRLFLITDAVAAVPYGDYPHIFMGDRYVLPDGTLSGSALTMVGAVKNAVQRVGMAIPEALQMASLYPSTLLGFPSLFGTIQPGAPAEFVLLDDQLNVLQVIVGDVD